jgi:hypothetical protein
MIVLDVCRKVLVDQINICAVETMVTNMAYKATGNETANLMLFFFQIHHTLHTVAKIRSLAS